MSIGWKTSTAVLVGVAALAACKPLEAQQPNGSSPGGDVVIATSMSRSGDVETHYAECGPDPAADFGEYRVVIPPEQDYGGLSEGAPCPAVPAEPMPADEHPELHRQLSDALYAPAPYEGGDLNTCGAWSADDPVDARAMTAECPPLTKGVLP